MRTPEKISIALAAAVTVASITYGGYCLAENTKNADAYRILASQLGYPEITPCPAPSDPGRKNLTEDDIVAIKIETPTPCPTPVETSELG